MTGEPVRIAIVGMGCRYPDADNPDELWETVLGRRRAFRAMPPERLDLRDYGGSPSEVDTTYVSRAAVLRGWEFDRARYRVAGSLFRSVDHAHWLALDTAHAALIDAGFPEGDGLDRDRTGVFVGNSLTGEFSRATMLGLRWPSLRHAVAAALAESGVDGDAAAAVLASAERHVRDPFPEPDEEMLAGGLSNTIAGRICNYFDFRGAGYTVDGACASSLLAVITACDALARGELSFALAGGVDLSLDPFELIGFARAGALADGEMRVYDAEPTGFLPGEGSGVVALMRADDARARGLRCYAELVGWATSSDGAGGVTRPEAAGQARAMIKAYARAGLSPAAAALIEGHGTGTAIGDQAELTALITARGPGAPVAALGSVKANIGHTKAAAGAAGLIKAAMAVYHRVIPPMTGNRTPHPLLAEPTVSLRLPAHAEPWPAGAAVASVSGAGFGGVNAHLVIDGGDRAGTAPPRALTAEVRRWSAGTPEYEPVLIEAADTTELTDRLAALAERAAALSAAEVHDLAATAARDREADRSVRCALVASTPTELAAAAAAAHARLPDWDGELVLDEGAGFTLAPSGPAAVGLLLPGQAAPVRDGLGALEVVLPAPPPPPDGVELTAGTTDTAVAQPAIVWQSLAGLTWLCGLGCRPVGAVGHSLGELSALVWAGAIEPKAALALAVRRGALMAEYGAAGTGMLAVSAGPREAATLTGGTAVVLAARNGPANSVLAGPHPDLEVVAGKAARAGIRTAALAVSHGFHSPAMRPVAEHWRAALEQVRFAAPRSVVFSTVTGAALSRSDDLTELLVEQLTEPVRFDEALRGLAARADLLVEVGPGTMLSTLAAATGTPAVSIDCGGSGRRLAFAAGALFAAGSADPAAWFADRGYRHVDLDTPLRFLANPCESMPKAAGSVVPSRPAPVEPPATPAQPAADLDTVTVVRGHLATELELPVEAIGAEAVLLADLHLNSLQVVQLVGTIAAALGRQPADLSAALGAATVADLAAALDELPEAGAPAASAETPGVRPWVQAFAHHWVEYTGGGKPRLDWRVRAPDDHPLHRILRAEPGEPRALAIVLDADAGPATVADMLHEVGSSAPDRLLIVHPGHPAAQAIGRSVSAEVGGCAVTVLDHGRDQDLSGVEALITATGYAELRRTSDGAVERVVTQVHRPRAGAARARIPLGSGDVCLVTGGVTGITAHCAAAVAERTGCTLVVLGRRQAGDPEVLAGLARLGPAAHYLSCDVTDRTAVAAAVRRAGRHGPVRGLFHGAGANRPRLIPAVTAQSLRETLAPKVDGLRALLDAAGDQLSLVVAFGSIIGRQGLTGQSEYCVANDWMRAETESWAARHPECRTHVIEWSVWSDIGMAVRMNVVEGLNRIGVAGIDPADGVDALLAVLTDRHAPVTTLAAGRFRPTPTLRLESPAPSHVDLRYAERLPAHTPGVEAVLEATLNTGADPYLGDHRIDGVAVLPAVLGMEAMAQAAAITVGHRDSWSLRDIRLDAPITVGDRDDRVLRIAALAEEEHGHPVVRVRVRQDGDGFAMNHVSGTVASPGLPPALAEPGDPPEPLGQAHPAYGPLLFHEGRFRRLVRYDVLSAFEVRAWISAGSGSDWFAGFHGQRLLLGDPGAHDASLHALLACVPHRRALPVGVDEFSAWRRPEGMLLVHAVERAHTADEYVFDLDVTAADGRAVARWRGLRLRAVGPNETYVVPRRGVVLPADLVGPWLSRRLIEGGWADGVALSTLSAGGAPAPFTASSRIGDHVLSAASDRPVGLDWRVTDLEADDMVPAVASARAALVRLGDGHEVTLVDTEADGITVFDAGRYRVVVAVRDTDIAPAPVAVAVAVPRDGTSR